MRLHRQGHHLRPVRQGAAGKTRTAHRVCVAPADLGADADVGSDADDARFHVHRRGEAALVEIVYHRITDRHAEGSVRGFCPARLVAAGEQAHGGKRAVRNVIKCGMVGKPRLHEEVILEGLLLELVHQLRAGQHLAMGIAVAGFAQKVPPLHAVTSTARTRFHEKVPIGQHGTAALQGLQHAFGEMHQHRHGPHPHGVTVLGKPDLVVHAVGTGRWLQDRIGGPDGFMRGQVKRGLLLAFRQVEFKHVIPEGRDAMPCRHFNLAPQLSGNAHAGPLGNRLAVAAGEDDNCNSERQRPDHGGNKRLQRPKGQTPVAIGIIAVEIFSRRHALRRPAPEEPGQCHGQTRHHIGEGFRLAEKRLPGRPFQRGQPVAKAVAAIVGWKIGHRISGCL